MILVIGSTGYLGSEICRLLREEGKPVRALVRNNSNPSKVETIERYGAEVTHGDLKDRHSLDFACHGIETVISTATSMMSDQKEDTISSVDLNGHLDLIDACKNAGVKRFIFLSIVNNPKIQHPLSDAKIRVEKYLENSGMDYTVLRCNWFMESWLSPQMGFDVHQNSVRIYGSGDNKINWVSFHDVAHIVVQTVNNPRARFKIFDIGGEEALSPLQVVRIFEDLQGKNYHIEHVSELTIRDQLKHEKDPKKKSFAGLMLQYANGIETNNRFHKYFNIKMTKIKTYAEYILSAEKV